MEHPAPQAIDFAGRLLVHVGPRKTGTTTLQQFLRRNRGKLLEQGILYPEAGRHSAKGKVGHYHHPMMRALVDGRAEEFARHADNMRAEIAREAPHTVILSSEVLGRPALGVAPFETLRAFFGEARREWLLYLRRQDDLLASSYAQSVKRGNVAWPTSIADLAVDDLLDHELRLETLESQIDGDKILARSFELTKSTLIQSLLLELGADPDPASYDPVPRANESLPMGTIHVLRYANAAPEPLKRLLRSVVRRGGGLMQRAGLNRGRTGDILSPEARADVLRRYADSNARVAARWFDGGPTGLNG